MFADTRDHRTTHGARMPHDRRHTALRTLLPLAALGCVLSAGCMAVRPGYCDPTSGRVYAGYAKPGPYPGELLCPQDCDCRGPAYHPILSAFSSYGGAGFCGTHRKGCRCAKCVPPCRTLPLVRTPPPADYADFPRGPGGLTGMNAAPTTPGFVPPAPATDEGLERGIDQDRERVQDPLEVDEDGIGVE